MTALARRRRNRALPLGSPKAARSAIAGRRQTDLQPTSRLPAKQRTRSTAGRARDMIDLGTGRTAAACISTAPTIAIKP